MTRREPEEMQEEGGIFQSGGKWQERDITKRVLKRFFC